MWYVYILETEKGKLYTGTTNDIERRMAAHKKGKGARFTRIFGFKKLLYFRLVGSQSEATKREAEIKRLSRKKKLILIDEK